ncbi:GTP pyrophosphokinase [Ligilactobacillus cholophilus]|uniref:GTP pyrophosphokinase n=1 Tax=Ligilactobacillus cholophilus TaxID=3050131 RepID=UPI0025B03D1C|nr:GTP pyrophosphokinase family protein [Ligilactobacillus cholophilus]
MDNWEEFLAPYAQAVSELELKLNSLKHQLSYANNHGPIEFVTGRVKTRESILEKMHRRHITKENIVTDMEDIAAVRIMCEFVDDIYQIVSILRKRHDMEIIEERDYIAHKKPSGYRSYHIIIRYSVELVSGTKFLKAEIQIRTLAMNFWATIEHSLNYKYKGEFPPEIAMRLRKTAEAAFLLDTEMSNIHDDIKEAEKLFAQRKRGQIEHERVEREEK